MKRAYVEVQYDKENSLMGGRTIVGPEPSFAAAEATAVKLNSMMGDLPGVATAVWIDMENPGEA